MFAPVQIKGISTPISQRVAAPVKAIITKSAAPVYHFFNGIFGAYPTANKGPVAKTPKGFGQ